MAAPSSPGTSRTVRDDLGYEEVAAIGAVSLALARYEGFPAHANAIEHVMNQVHASP
jgi:histidinol dehydrogenase